MNEFLNVEATRRGFFARSAMLTAGATAASLMLARGASATPTNNLGIPTTGAGAFVLPGSGDTQVLNYALTLEDLEADLYAQALLRLQGGGVTPQTSSTVGTITGLGLPDNDPVVVYLKQFAPIEAAHRDFLFSALGGSGLGSNAITQQVPKKYNFTTPDGTTLNARDRIGVLNLVLEAEATGVQAYLGAVPFLSTGSQYLAIAAAIQGTEARHTSALTIVRNLLVATGGDSSDPARTPVAPLKGDLGGVPQSTTGASHGSANYAPATPNLGDANGIDLYLLPSEVVSRVAGFIKTA